MFDQMKKLMEVKKQAEQIKRELESASLEVNEVRGIKIVIDGSQTFQSIEIDDNLFNTADKNKIQLELLRGLNIAIRKSQALAAQKMKAVTGLNIPGF